MKCVKCGKKLNRLNHHYVPETGKNRGKRYCIECAKNENIVTLV